MVDDAQHTFECLALASNYNSEHHGILFSGNVY